MAESNNEAAMKGLSRLAQPVTLTEKGPITPMHPNGQERCLIFGGLTKRQEIAARILAGMTSASDTPCIHAINVVYAVELADELIARTEGPRMIPDPQDDVKTE